MFLKIAFLNSLMILEGRFLWKKLVVVSILQGINQKLISVGRKELIKFSELKKILKPVGVPPFTKHLEVCKLWIVEKLLQQNKYSYILLYIFVNGNVNWKKIFCRRIVRKYPYCNFFCWKTCYRSTPVENFREKLIFLCFRFAIENVCTFVCADVFQYNICDNDKDDGKDIQTEDNSNDNFTGEQWLTI